jgi:SAM-dependent MidA family methyltransferase
MRFRAAMQEALYGPEGFFTRTRPASHFLTSAQSPLFARALGRLIHCLDEQLGHPDPLDVVDVGAGGGELLANLEPLLPSRARLQPIEVGDAIPSGIVGLLLATEWLDNVPLDLAEDGRYLYDDEPLSALDAAWIQRWWPSPAGTVEIGRRRDEAWAQAVGHLERGLALTVDYGHFLGTRPSSPTLAGFRDGREVEPRLDGTTDLTCHVAIDSAAAATGLPWHVMTQREALHWLGVRGARPPLELAHGDPAGYLRALAEASEAATLTDPNGFGGHWWLLHPLGCAL